MVNLPVVTDVASDLDEAGRPALHRSIGPFQMTLYGLGSMLGSGIYGLIGQAAAQVGNAVWLAFLVALVAALLTALTYASLGSRYPAPAERLISRSVPIAPLSSASW
jgi:basic amino acid/polyamine antiporter, APA family